MISLLACIMAAALVLYCLLAGADYGAGLWDLLSSGAHREQQKELIANAIQPIWEANHVWLILIFVLLFAGFPPAFAAIMTALFVPILLMLAGIVLRGAAFVFRAYSTTNSEMQRAWGYVFSVSSCFTPFFAGIVLGAISDDSVIVSHDASVNGYLFNWLNAFTIFTGLFTLALFAFLAAAYLSAEATSEELRRAFARRAAAAGVTSGILAVVTFLLSGEYARGFSEGLMHNDLARGSELTAATALALACFSLYKGRTGLLRLMAAAFAGSAAVGWAAAQFPYLVRPERTIFNSAVSETVIRDVVLASGAGAVVLFPSLGLLLYIFKFNRHQQGGR